MDKKDLMLKITRPVKGVTHYTIGEKNSKTVESILVKPGMASADALAVTVAEWEKLPERIDVGGSVKLSISELDVQPIIHYDFENAPVKRIQTVDGERAFADFSKAPSEVVGAGMKLTLRIDWPGNTHVYGLGQHEEGIYLYENGKQYLYQHNMKSPVPVLLTTAGVGFLFDAGCTMTYEGLGRYALLTFDCLESLSVFVLSGNFDKQINQYRILTGPAPMLPLWCFGYMQSREKYTTQQELIDISKKYRDLGIPLDTIIQDWKYWQGNLWGEKAFDPERYPDPAKAMDELHAMDVHALISIWPNVNKGGNNYPELKKAACLLGDDSTCNSLNPIARELYWKHVNSGLFSKGFDGFWCDSTEPFSGPDWGGTVKLNPAEKYRRVAGEHNRFLPQTLSNTYSFHHSMGLYENWRKTNNDKRVVNLTRSCYAGQQRFSTIVWSGDISANWGTLKRQIAEGLSMCMSGIPYWTLDAGAFFVGNVEAAKRFNHNPNMEKPWFWEGDYEGGNEDLGYRELYTRWLQLASVLPIFRSHGTDTYREVWFFGERGTMFRDAIEKTIKQRYRYIPYIYSLARKVYSSNYTMLRSLAFDFEDERSLTTSDEFMFGPALLAAPVIEPMYYAPESKPIEAEKTRKVWLPECRGWYCAHCGKYFDGNKEYTVDAPIDVLPLFVKAGSIVPTWEEEVQSTAGVHEITINVYAGANAEFTLYFDKGDGYGYENGEYTEIKLKYSELFKFLTIEDAVSPAGTSFLSPEQTFKVHYITPSGEKTIAVLYSGRKKLVKLF